MNDRGEAALRLYSIHAVFLHLSRQNASTVCIRANLRTSSSVGREVPSRREASFSHLPPPMCVSVHNVAIKPAAHGERGQAKQRGKTWPKQKQGDRASGLMRPGGHEGERGRPAGRVCVCAPFGTSQPSRRNARHHDLKQQKPLLLARKGQMTRQGRARAQVLKQVSDSQDGVAQRAKGCANVCVCVCVHGAEAVVRHELATGFLAAEPFLTSPFVGAAVPFLAVSVAPFLADGTRTSKTCLLR